MAYTLYYSYGPAVASINNLWAVQDYHFGTFLPTRGWDVYTQTGVLYGQVDANYYWYHKDFATLTGDTISEHTLWQFSKGSNNDGLMFDTSNSIPNYTTGPVQANWDGRKQFYADTNWTGATTSAQWWVNTDGSWFVISNGKLWAFEMPPGGYVNRATMTLASTLSGPTRMVWFPDGGYAYLTTTTGQQSSIVSGLVKTGTILTRASDLVALADATGGLLYWIGSPADILQKWHSGTNLLMSTAVTVTQIGSNFYFFRMKNPSKSFIIILLNL